MSMHSVIKWIYLKIEKFELLNFLPDELFVRLLYRVAMGKKLDLKHPRSFNEKIQWIKLYDHNPLYTVVADKYAVREYVKDKVGEEYLIPLLGKWDSVDDIAFDELPDSFVLKCNHDSGGVVICGDRKDLDVEAAKKKLRSHLKRNHYSLSREWGYKEIRRCIIGEKYLIDDETKELRDYKFFCFNGKPAMIQVDFDRFVDHKRNLYTPDWELLDLTIKCPNDPSADIRRPVNLDEMLAISEKLSAGFPEMRVDLYSVNGKTYFGELTVYHGGGIEKFTPESYGLKLGDMIDLSLVYRE